MTPGEIWNAEATVTTTKMVPKADIVFVVDHTASMTTQINWVAEGLGDTVRRLLAAGGQDINIGIVSYDDTELACYGGKYPGYTGKYMNDWYSTDMPLKKNSAEALSAEFKAIANRVTTKQYCHGGATHPESTFAAVQKAAVESPWRDDAIRYVVNVADTAWRVEPGTIAGGFPSTMQGLPQALAVHDVKLSAHTVECPRIGAGRCVNDTPAGSPGAVFGPDVVASLKAAGVDATHGFSQGKQQLNDNIAINITETITDWDITHKTTCVYESDKAPSTDLDVQVTPAMMTIEAGKSDKFPETVTAKAVPARFNDTTVCTVQFNIEGISGGPSYVQMITMKVDDPGNVTLKKSVDVPKGEIAKAGQVVNYSVEVYNDSDAPVANASFVDKLDGVLDDATFNVGSISVAPNIGSAAFDAATKTLNWNGPLAGRAKVTVNYSVTVGKDMGGNHKLTNGVTSDHVKTNCPVGGTDPACSTETEVGGFNLTKGASVPSGTAVARGTVLTYTVDIHNDSLNAITGGTFVDDLTGVLDDATMVAGSIKTTGGGTASLNAAGNKINWSGDLAVGAKAQLTYQVKVNTAVTVGNNSLVNRLVSEHKLSNCAAGSTDPSCETVHPVEGMSIVKTSNVPAGQAVAAGQDVTYQIVAKNTGSTAISGATFTDDLSKVLNGAVLDTSSITLTPKIGDYVHDAAGNKLVWTGNLAPGQDVTLSYTVKVNDKGHTATSKLENTVVSTTPGVNCAAGSDDPGCKVILKIKAVEVTKIATTGPVTTGDQVTYTIKVKNTGSVDVLGESILDDFTDAQDDGWINKGQPKATSGTITTDLPDNKFTWVGDLKVGETATITAEFTVREPFQSNGNRIMRNVVIGGGNCQAGSVDPACSASTNIKVIRMVLSSDADPSVALTAGQKVTYTVTGTNYSPMRVEGIDYTVDLADVLDNATIDENSITSKQRDVTPKLEGTNLRWTGGMDADQEFVTTFTATVGDLSKGNTTLISSISSAAYGATCPVKSENPDCTSTLYLPGVTFAISTDLGEDHIVNAGGYSSYTVDVTNMSGLAAKGVSFDFNLDGILDDAKIKGEPSATGTDGAGGILSKSGAAKVNQSDKMLSWTGDIPANGTAKVSFQVKTDLPGTGDHELKASLISAAAGSNCAKDSKDLGCATNAKIREIAISKTANPADGAKPGDLVTYTINVQNVGAVAFPDVYLEDDLTDVLKAATFKSIEPSSLGTTAFVSPRITWAGDLAVGEKTAIVYSVQLNDSIKETTINSTIVSNVGTNCFAGSVDPKCSAPTALVKPLTVGPLTLPITGVDAGRIITGVGVLLLAGAFMLFLARRRKGEQV